MTEDAVPNPHGVVRVRRAVADDAPQLRMLIDAAMAAYARDSAIPGLLDAQREDIDDLRRHIADDIVLIAELEGVPVGTARLVLGDGKEAYFSRFAVDPHLHRGGVGGILYAEAESELRRQGCQAVSLHTALSNTALLRFYQQRGFLVIGCSEARGYPRGLLRKALSD